MPSCSSTAHSTAHSAMHSTAHSSTHYEPPGAAVKNIRTNLSLEPKNTRSESNTNRNRDDDVGHPQNMAPPPLSDNNTTSTFRYSYHDQMKMAEEHHVFSSDTWTSLLGLLAPIEFFVTVDSFPIWRRHVAWAKPDGNELRHYTTQRFSSNMVLLSLLLGTEMTFLLDSETRQALKHASYNSFVFWLGITIMISACITVIGLVATFTAWGMVSAISDANTHCLLRSNIGQYVTSLPAHFVVASLYIFFLWLIMWIINLLNGGFVCMVLILWVCYVFFQVVISLSAFGRLIIHTGAMGTASVLDPSLERRLLPSGLHTSLLIKAMHRKGKCASAVSQYRTAQHIDDEETRHGHSSLNYGSVLASTRSSAVPEEQTIMSPLISFDSRVSTTSSMDDEESNYRRISVQDSFPRPSILNSTSSKNIFAVVQSVLSKFADWETDTTTTTTATTNNNSNSTTTTTATTNNNVLPHFQDSTFVHPVVTSAGVGHRRTGSGLDAILEKEEMNGDESLVFITTDLEQQLKNTDQHNNDEADPRRGLEFHAAAAAATIRDQEIANLTRLASKPPDARRSESAELLPKRSRMNLASSLVPRRLSPRRKSFADFLRGQIKRASWLDNPTHQEWIEENEARELYSGPTPSDQGSLLYGDDDDDDDDGENDQVDYLGERVVVSPKARLRKLSPTTTTRNKPWVHSPPLPPSGRKLASSFHHPNNDVTMTSTVDRRVRRNSEHDRLLPKE